MKKEFFNQVNKNFFMDDLDMLTNYVQQNCKDEVETIIKKADEVVAQTFLFNLRWDMEYTVVPVHFENEIDWLTMPSDDVEWIFAFNRHHYWINLGQAYLITKKEIYAQTFVKQCSGWIKRVKLNNKDCQNAWRTIEAGLRMTYWLKAMCFFENSQAINDDFMSLFLESIKEHAEYIMSIDGSTHIVSNWGVLENQGLFVAGVMLPTTDRTKEYRSVALGRLFQQIQAQVYPDGVHWEQSTMYHNEVTQCFLDVCILAKRNEIELPTEMLDKLYKMCLFCLHHKKPNHYEIEMGDSDEIDVRDIVNKGAYLFKSGLLKACGNTHFDFDTIWDLGFQASVEYDQIKIEKITEVATSFAESGHYFLRSDDSEMATYLHFNCGTHGGGHGHSDKLHIDLFANGEDILIDSGRYTYVDKPERFEFKSALAHNVCIVDGQDNVEYNKSWGFKKRSYSVNQKMVVKDPYYYLEGGHLGYMHLGVYVNRRIVYLKPDLFVIMDEFYGSSMHTYEQYFHFNDIGEVQRNGNKATYLSVNNKVDFIWLSDDLNLEMINTRYSRHYNEAKGNKTIRTQIKGEGFKSIITLISINKATEYDEVIMQKDPISYTANGKEIAQNVMEAITIKKGSKEFTLVFAHEDYLGPSDTFTVKGHQGLGHMVIFDQDQDKFLGETLLY